MAGQHTLCGKVPVEHRLEAGPHLVSLDLAVKRPTASVPPPAARIDDVGHKLVDEPKTPGQQRSHDLFGNAWCGVLAAQTAAGAAAPPLNLQRVDGLQVSLNAAEAKLTDLDRRATPGGLVDLGLPTIGGSTRPA